LDLDLDGDGIVGTALVPLRVPPPTILPPTFLPLGPLLRLLLLHIRKPLINVLLLLDLLDYCLPRLAGVPLAGLEEGHNVLVRELLAHLLLSLVDHGVPLLLIVHSVQDFIIFWEGLAGLGEDLRVPNDHGGARALHLTDLLGDLQLAQLLAQLRLKSLIPSLWIGLWRWLLSFPVELAFLVGGVVLFVDDLAAGGVGSLDGELVPEELLAQIQHALGDLLRLVQLIQLMLLSHPILSFFFLLLVHVELHEVLQWVLLLGDDRLSPLGVHRFQHRPVLLRERQLFIEESVHLG